MSEDYDKLKKLALAWKRAAPRIRAMRNVDIRRQSNAQAIISLNSLFRQAIKQTAPPKSSGFVKMYEALRRQSND
jgi:hypothetical protein